MLNEGGQQLAEPCRVLLVQVDLVGRAAELQAHCLVGRPAVKIILQLNGYLRCHPGLQVRGALTVPYKINFDARGSRTAAPTSASASLAMLLTTGTSGRVRGQCWRSRAPSPLSDGGSRTMPAVDLLRPPVPGRVANRLALLRRISCPVDPLCHGPRPSAAPNANQNGSRSRNTLKQTFEFQLRRAPLRNRTVDLLLTIDSQAVRATAVRALTSRNANSQKQPPADASSHRRHSAPQTAPWT